MPSLSRESAPDRNPGVPGDRFERVGEGSAEGRLSILGTDQETAWMEVIHGAGGYDFCHLPRYHRVSELNGDGTARLFVWKEAGHMIALPLLVRPVNPAKPDGWQDATSVYGYGGPIVSPSDIPESVIRHFQSALRHSFHTLRIVTAFSRLHPLLPQHHVLQGLGEFRIKGPTISIDLTQSEEVQWAGYHKRCRNSIRKLLEAGFVGLHDTEMRYLPEFVEVYHETMGRVSAHQDYYFDLPYFRTLARELGPALHLFVVLYGNQVAGATLATLAGGIMQDFLGGSRNAFLKMSPDRLSVDTERRCARQMGAHVLHLGGGVGSQEDSVFEYKSRFSDRRHTFSTWQALLLPDVYQELCEEKARLNAIQGRRATNPDYFPAYRCPTVPL